MMLIFSTIIAYVCRFQQMFQITDLTMRSKAKVIYTYNLCYGSKSELLFHLFTNGVQICQIDCLWCGRLQVYRNFTITYMTLVKGQGQIYFKSVTARIANPAFIFLAGGGGFIFGIILAYDGPETKLCKQQLLASFSQLVSKCGVKVLRVTHLYAMGNDHKNGLPLQEIWPSHKNWTD